MNTKIIKFDINKNLYDTLIAKQGDTKSRFLLFNLLDGSIPFSLENRSVRVYAIKPDGTEVFNDLIITDVSKGYCILELTNQMLAVAGSVKLELMVMEGDKKLTSNIFYMDVKESINSEKAVVSTNEFGTLLTALASLNEYDNYKNEIAAARDGEKNLLTKVKKIDEQLDTKANERFQNQESFVNTLKRHTKFKDTFSVSCINLLKTQFSVVLPFLDDKYLEYNTGKSSIDGYTRFNEGKIGELVETPIISYEDMDAKTGAWVTDNSPNWYTTEVGATMTKSFFGYKIDLQLYTDNRGGVWEFVLDNDVENKIAISTYRASSGNITIPIFTKSKNEQHKLVATFKGADPSNPPSGGTPRGWCYGGSSTNAKTFAISKMVITVNSECTPLFGDSNKEFAFEVRKGGTSNPYHFVPLHGVTPTANAIYTKFIVNGVEKTFSQGEMIEDVTEFQISQSIYGKLPESEQNLIKVSTITTFRNDGVVNIDGRMETLTDVDFSTGFGIMFPLARPFCEVILNSINKKYPTIRDDGYVEYLQEEIDFTESFLGLSNTIKNIGVACDFNVPKNTLRQGCGYKNAKNNLRTWIQHRDNRMAKVYQEVYRQSIVPKGEVYRFSGTFIVGRFSGLSDLFL